MTAVSVIPGDLQRGVLARYRAAVKGKDLANYTATDLADLWQAANRGLRRIRRNATLLSSFLAHTGLNIPIL